jgi:hypothetical protein
MFYEQKYIKYKNKYLSLQSQIGGGVDNIMPINNMVPQINNQINHPNNLIMELNNYIDRAIIRDYIVGILQANMGGQIPVAILNYPNNFNNNIRDLCHRFFNLFNSMNNFFRDNLVTRLNNLNFINDNNNRII